MVLLAALPALAAGPPGRVSVELKDASRATGSGWAVVRLLDPRGRALPAAGDLTLRGAQGTRVGALSVEDGGLGWRAWVEPAVRGAQRITNVEAFWEGRLVGGLKIDEPLAGPPPPEPLAPAPSRRRAEHDREQLEAPPALRPPLTAAPIEQTRLTVIEPDLPAFAPPLTDVIGPPTALVAAPPPPSPWLPPQTALRARTVIDAAARGRSPGVLLSLDAQGGSERAAGGLSASTGRQMREGAPVSGQASLFGRARLFATPWAALAAGLDASLPGYGPESLSLSPVRARASLAAGVHAGDFTVTTMQALAAGTPSSALRPSGWDSSTSVSTRLLPSLDVAAQLDGLVSWADDAGYRHAFAAGAGLSLRLGALQLGAGLRAGITADGAVLYGRASATCSISIARRD
jgi:hypothetical protein